MATFTPAPASFAASSAPAMPDPTTIKSASMSAMAIALSGLGRFRPITGLAATNAQRLCERKRVPDERASEVDRRHARARRVAARVPGGDDIVCERSGIHSGIRGERGEIRTASEREEAVEQLGGRGRVEISHIGTRQPRRQRTKLSDRDGLLRARRKRKAERHRCGAGAARNETATGDCWNHASLPRKLSVIMHG